MADMKTDLLIITALESELKRDVLPAGVEIIYSGLGKINAALASIKAIDQFSPRKIINFGTAGKINPKLEGLLEIGRVIQRDMMAEPLAPRGKTPFCNKPSEYFSSGKHVCGSGDSFVTTTDLWLLEQGVDVVDMELFAIAAVASYSGIEWASYKFISDEANESSGQVWSSQVKNGQQLFADQLLNYL
jgi:adenosylhomocysteine nucleosidase